MQIQNILEIQALTKIVRTITGSAWQVAFCISYKWTEDEANNESVFLWFIILTLPGLSFAKVVRNLNFQ